MTPHRTSLRPLAAAPYPCAIATRLGEKSGLGCASGPGALLTMPGQATARAAFLIAPAYARSSGKKASKSSSSSR